MMTLEMQTMLFAAEMATPSMAIVSVWNILRAVEVVVMMTAEEMIEDVKSVDLVAAVNGVVFYPSSPSLPVGKMSKISCVKLAM